MKILRWINGNTLNNKIRNECIHKKLEPMYKQTFYATCYNAWRFITIKKNAKHHNAECITQCYFHLIYVKLRFSITYVTNIKVKYKKLVRKTLRPKPRSSSSLHFCCNDEKDIEVSPPLNNSSNLWWVILPITPPAYDESSSWWLLQTLARPFPLTTPLTSPLSFPDSILF